MDYGAVIGRAWQIIRQHAWLWILGLLLVGLGSGTLDLTLPSGFDMTGDAAVPQYSVESVAAIVALVGVTALIGLALWIVGVAARGALIAAVNAIENGAKTSLRVAWSAGEEHFGRLFLIGLITAVPGLLLTFLTFVAALPGVAGSAGGEVIAMTVAACLLPLCCALVAVEAILGPVQHFADRAAVIEDLPPRAALRRGWRVLADHLPQTSVLAAIWLFLLLVARLLIVLPLAGVVMPMLFLGVAAPSLEAGALGVTCLTGFVLATGLILFAVLGAFTSAMWTVAYRDWAGLPSASRQTREMPAPDLDLRSASDDTLIAASRDVTGDTGEHAPVITAPPIVPPDPFAAPPATEPEKTTAPDEPPGGEAKNPDR